jgi:UDP-N-acetylmuramoyl-L-alanyl-D-glutamate--2,6-diaminopimelate ligase
MAGLVNDLPAFQGKITGIALDSRQVQPGNLFVAIVGGNADGHLYIGDAIQRGAAVVVGERSIAGLPVPYIQVKNSREALAYLSAAFYGWPARQLTVIGVTGTDGKTTTSNLIYHILLAAGIRTGMITTVNAVIGDQVLDTGFHVTTPEAPQVQHYLAQMVSAGITHAVLEVTSHGLAQHRVTACEFDLGVITNITHEHLDYHGSFEAYREAKARLFVSLRETAPKPQGNFRVAILNRDDLSYSYLQSVILDGETNEAAEIRLYSYGLHPAADLRAEAIKVHSDGIEFVAVKDDFRWPIFSRLYGRYNVYNCLAAAAVTALGLGIEPEMIQQGIAAVTGVPGRMERIDLGQDFLAIVDFAHTPNALRVALQSARELVAQHQGRVIAVFGSAGLRDRAKRRLMAETAAELADFTVLTAEDPRTESLDDILAEMAGGAKSRGGIEGRTFWRIPDRGQAIRFGVGLARSGDVVLALGKGHEQSMCFGEIEYPWDDRVAMKAALAERLGVRGPDMPYLPTQDK